MESANSMPGLQHHNNHGAQGLQGYEKENDHPNHMDRPPYALDPSKSFKAVYDGSCFCGEVVFEVARDKPLDAKFCHCTTCQKLHGAPFQWAAIFEKNDVHFTRGKDQLIYWNAEKLSQEYSLPCKISCSACRTPIMDEGRTMLMLFPTLIAFGSLNERRKFYPTCHIFYSSRVVDIRDGLPKFEKHKDQSPRIPESL